MPLIDDSIVKFGIIGTGFGASVHAPAILANTNCVLTGICGQDLNKTQNIASNLNITATNNYQELIDSNIDAVTIAVPPEKSFEIAKYAINAGKHIFLEKPMALNLASAEKLLELAKRNNVIGVIDFQFPEITAFQTCQQLLNDKIIGKVHNIIINFHVATYANLNNIHNWKTDSTQGGGALLNFASHIFYYLEWFGFKIKQLNLNAINTSEIPNNNTLVNFAGICENKTGFACSVSTNSRYSHNHKIEFFGEDGSVVLENNSQDYMSGFKLKYNVDDNWVELDIISDYLNKKDNNQDGRILPVARLINKLANFLLGQDEVLWAPDFETGVRIQRYLETS